ncbi:MAG: hypothetical protein IKW86_09770 [Salinivirgaceae bacterium]|nr:hypothetical protein [Salinivirgaceae bacterium]
MDNLIDILKDFWVLLVPIIIGAVSSFLQKDKKQAAASAAGKRHPEPNYSYNAEHETQPVHKKKKQNQDSAYEYNEGEKAVFVEEKPQNEEPADTEPFDLRNAVISSVILERKY